MQELWRLVERARAADPAELEPAMTAVWRRMNTPMLWLSEDMGEVEAEMDALCDRTFPLPEGAGLADILDSPWPTAARKAALESYMDNGGWLNEATERAIADQPSPERTRLLRLLLTSRLGQGKLLGRVAAGALANIDAIDAELVEGAFTRDTQLGSHVSFTEELRREFDELVWRLTAQPNPADWGVTPLTPRPGGERFEQRGLDIEAGRLPVAPGIFDFDTYAEDMVRHLCGLPDPPERIYYHPDKLRRNMPGLEVPEGLELRWLWLSSRDNKVWHLSFEDGVEALVDVQSDDLKNALEAQPDLAVVQKDDPDYFIITAGRRLTPEEMLQRYVSAIAAAATGRVA